MTATPPSSPSAAPIRCWRRATCARRPSPPTWSTCPRSATSPPTPFPPSSRRAKAQGALVATNPGVRQLSSRGGAFQETLTQIDILAVNRSEADVLVPGLVARFGEGGRALTSKPGETLPRLAARGFVGGGHEMGAGRFLRRPARARAPLRGGDRWTPWGVSGHRRTRSCICPVLETKVAGTAGAGDAFNATFTAFVAMGRGADEALRAAAINSASVVEPHRHADRPAAPGGDRQAPWRDQGHARGAHMVALAGGAQDIPYSLIRQARLQQSGEGHERVGQARSRIGGPGSVGACSWISTALCSAWHPRPTR